MKAEIEIYNSAKQLFKKFENGAIEINLFKEKLIALALEMTDFDVNILIEDYIKPQFAAYIENPNRNSYLLSTASSGSLLQQFQPYNS